MEERIEVLLGIDKEPLANIGQLWSSQFETGRAVQRGVKTSFPSGAVQVNLQRGGDMTSPPGWRDFQGALQSTLRNEPHLAHENDLPRPGMNVVSAFSKRLTGGRRDPLLPSANALGQFKQLPMGPLRGPRNFLNIWISGE